MEENNLRINNLNILEKYCKDHLKNFPNENPWIICNDDYFYKNNSKKGFNTYCKKCCIIRSQNNPNKKEIGLATYYNHIEERIIKMRVRRSKSREKDRTYLRTWQINNSEKCEKYNQNRKKKNHDISKIEWEKCKQYFDYKCAYCGLDIKENYKNINNKIKLIDFSKEHPYNNEDNNLSNCIPSCQSCNSKKWKYNLDEWYNSNNIIYSPEKYEKIIQWISEDYKKNINK
jgi:5-methylcytosine-specific restriction endonuclease McrA